jgi:nucleotide-binding universal stress UspA family protein
VEFFPVATDFCSSNNSTFIASSAAISAESSLKPTTILIQRDCGWKQRNLAGDLQPIKTRRSDMKILLATDGSDCSKAAVNSVAERPWPEGSEVKIVSTIDIPNVPTSEAWVLPDSYYTELDGVAKALAEAAVKDAAERIKAGKPPGLEIITEIRNGHAKEVILDEAEKWGADLIVLGSHGYSGWQRFLLGSVSHAVATHAHCSVEIVRQKSVMKK